MILETSAAPTPRLAECLADLTTLHRHICPRQVLGVRMGLHAGEVLGVELPRDDKRLLVFVETDGCFADSISVATGCWLGHRTMRLIDHGKSAATVVDTRTWDAVRVWPDPNARSRAEMYAPDAPDRWHAMRDGYLVMPIDELVRAAHVTVDLDLRALIGRNGKRAVCADCGEDIINQRGVAHGGLVLCRGCAGSSYFRIRST